MQVKRQILLLFLSIYSISVSGQVDSIKQEIFYETEGNQAIKEIYYVKKGAPNILHGSYTAFFQDGRIKISGRYENNIPYGIWRFYYENGNLKKQADRYNEVDGYWKYFYENGNARMEGEFIDNVREGDWIFYYEDESVKSEGAFLNGNKNGVWKYYNEDGSLQSESEYRNGIGEFKEYYTSGRVQREGFIKDGKSDSLWKEYHETGELKAQGFEKEGKKSGIWEYYFPNGEVQAKGSYYEGQQLGTWKYFNSEGGLSSEGTLENGYKTGLWNSYSIDGKLISQGDYVDGSGAYKEFYELSGNVKIVGFIEDGEKVGTWKFYSNDGILQRECDFKSGVGDCVGYYPDGSKQMTGKMKGNQEVGTWTHFDEMGRIDGYKKYSGLDSESTGLEADSSVRNSFSLVDLFASDDTSQVKGPRYTSTVKHHIRHESKFIWWNKWKNIEKNGLILGTNPLAVINGQLPITLEYYIEARLGHEIGYTYLWDPFLRPRKKIELNELLITGNDFFIRQKFYFKRNEHSAASNQRPFEVLGYFGHEIRLTRENYDFSSLDTLGAINHYQASSQRIEWTPLLGARVLENPAHSGWSFDVVFGVGIGYKTFKENFQSTEQTNNVLNSVRSSGITVPIRVGFSFGYLF